MKHIYTGDGKGKTTAAMGLALRAIHAGRRLAIIQFLKGRESGEIALLKNYENVEILRGKPSTKFTNAMSTDELEQTRKLHNSQLESIISHMKRGEIDLIILDEVFGALNLKLLDEQLLKQILELAGDDIELIMTGRGAPDSYIEVADYVSEILSIKHPFDKGLKMRKGVEY